MRKSILTGLIIGITIIVIGSILAGVLIPRNELYTTNWEGEPLIANSAATYTIQEDITNSFATYKPTITEVSPSIKQKSIAKGLTNVDFQRLEISNKIKQQLEQTGFAITESTKKDIFDIYGGIDKPLFITTDVCLHAFHLYFDASLRLIEYTNFYNLFEEMLDSLREDQLELNETISDAKINEVLNRNIAYLTIMQYLLDNETIIPAAVEEMVNEELTNINNLKTGTSSIFGYPEFFDLYEVRGHYTRNERLSNFFKAFMYASRMGFKLQGDASDSISAINQTRMALLLISSFNSTIWDYWKKIYEPTTFYVGISDDLTPEEYYQIWKELGEPPADSLDNDTLIEQFIDEAKNYRKPKINSMFIYQNNDFEDKTQSMRLFGQRFIPDSYIFQQLTDDNVQYRTIPNGLDIFSVLGSPRAEYHLQEVNTTYSNYSDQIQKLREEFGNLNASDWTQSLYWLWIYSLFPLLEPASPKPPKGYVEPYPEVYSRLSTLTQYFMDGLVSRELVDEYFINHLQGLKSMYDTLTTISQKELDNIKLTESEYEYIKKIGNVLYEINEFQVLNSSINEDRMAIIADVAGAFDNGLTRFLEVATGDPFLIYVIVPDEQGNLRLTKGGIFSYYEFISQNSVLSDEEWWEMLDTTPPDLPSWIKDSLPFAFEDSTIQMIESRRKIISIK
ncbi:MAG: DUF3160 domain-containing protein [Candidatus Heimdallarchaeota archaeon]|nr:DUF3160 domain-containing protein [Candidatus Heimdallarchaeota archaeon]